MKGVYTQVGVKCHFWINRGLGLLSFGFLRAAGARHPLVCGGLWRSFIPSGCSSLSNEPDLSQPWGCLASCTPWVTVASTDGLTALSACHTFRSRDFRSKSRASILGSSRYNQFHRIESLNPELTITTRFTQIRSGRNRVSRQALGACSPRWCQERRRGRCWGPGRWGRRQAWRNWSPATPWRSAHQANKGQSQSSRESEC